MKTSSWILAATIVVVGAGAYALTAEAQQGKDKPPTKPAGSDAAMGMPTPGAEHKLLAETVGKWNFKATMNGPMGPMESTGTTERKMALGGWYLEDTTHGSMMGMAFDGHGFTSYDTMKKKYVGVWLDSMSGGAVMPSEGTYDADHFTTTFTKVGSDGKGPGDFKIEYTRSK